MDTILSTSDFKKAHADSYGNHAQILASQTCGCFYCLSTYAADEVQEFTDEGADKPGTAICPYCNIDSVLGDASGHPVADSDFLLQMQAQAFGTHGPVSDGEAPAKIKAGAFAWLSVVFDGLTPLWQIVQTSNFYRGLKYWRELFRLN